MYEKRTIQENFETGGNWYRNFLGKVTENWEIVKRKSNGKFEGKFEVNSR